MTSEKNILRSMYMLMIISAVIRGFIAGFIELGNDEVYYWTYALYPDLSHFDHPPMVGWLIQLFTLDLTFHNEFFLRLAAIVMGTVNTYLVFHLGRIIKDPLTGFYCAVLYTASIYCAIIAGTFILPDAPLVFFWLLSMIALVKVFFSVENASQGKWMLFAGLFIGLAMISKYHAGLLWVCLFIFILVFNRKWLRSRNLYLAVFISLLVFLPVLIWNIKNHFISFTYQGDRIDVFKSGLNLDFFWRELLGQILYNNPVNFVLIIFAIISLARGNTFLRSQKAWFLLLTSLPVIMLFLLFSLFRSTLPHWSGPAYLSLLILTASWLSSNVHEKKPSRSLLFPVPLKVSLALILVVIVIGVGQVRYGWIKINGDHIKDVSIEMYGWKQMGDAFGEIYNKELEEGKADSDMVIISQRWFPAANIDYYIASPLNIKVLGMGKLNRIHKYAWINDYRGGFRKGMNAYFITTSFDYADPVSLYGYSFDTIIQVDTIQIFRSGSLINKAYVYRLEGLKEKPNIFQKH